MKTVFVDVDSTVAGSLEQWLLQYNCDYNDSISLEDVKSWQVSKYTKIGNRFFEYFGNADCWNATLPIEGAVRAIQELGWNFKVVFATSGVFQAKLDWLRARFDNEIVFASDKSLLQGDCLIDDRIKNVVDFNGFSVLFSQPWNVKSNFPVRAHNWNEAVKLVKRRFYAEEY